MARSSRARHAFSYPVAAFALAAAMSASMIGCGAGPAPFIDDPLVARIYQVVPPDVIVRNDDGAISLSGFIEGIGREQGLIEAAASVEGVRSVDSNLIVREDDD